MSQRGEAFDSNCMTLTRFIIQAQKKHKVSITKLFSNHNNCHTQHSEFS